MVSRTLICNVDITHRAASDVCNKLNQNTYDTSICLRKQGESRTCNAKSLLGLLSLVLKKGDICEIMLEEDCADRVLNSISEYFELTE